MSELRMNHYKGGDCYINDEEILVIEPASEEGCTEITFKNGSNVYVLGDAIQVHERVKRYKMLKSRDASLNAELDRITNQAGTRIWGRSTLKRLPELLTELRETYKDLREHNGPEELND